MKNTKSVIAISAASLLALLVVVGGMVYAITTNTHTHAQQYTTCVQSGANPSECRLSIYGTR